MQFLKSFGSRINQLQTITISGLANNEVKLEKKVQGLFNKHDLKLSEFSAQTINPQHKSHSQIYFKLNADISLQNANLYETLLEDISGFAEVSIDGEKPHVPWFPRTLTEINDVGKHLLDRPDESAQSHPYFKDTEYRKRRDKFNDVAQSWIISDPIPHIDYTQDDLKAWSYIYRNIKPLHQQYFCKKFNENFAKLEKYCKLGENNICQLGTISEYLQKETGFRLKPVHGILSQREFLNALAHRVFCCTQYIRHHENPEYTPEPDMIHEVMGHMSLLSDPEFADLSQKIGLVSLGQSDENIAKIGALYLYTIEFGSIKEGEDVKCYGAGIASCIDEIKNFVQNKEKRRRLNPTKDLPLNYPIQTVQDVFFVADNLSHATESLLSYSRGLRRPFLAWYDYSKKEVVVDKSVKMIH